MYGDFLVLPLILVCFDSATLQMCPTDMYPIRLTHSTDTFVPYYYVCVCIILLGRSLSHESTNKAGNMTNVV